MPIRVFIVDDEPLARGVLRHFLANWPDAELAGEFGGGTEALEAVQRLRPDLVFLDIQIPDLNGLELVDDLGRRSLPVIVFVTAHDHYAVRAFAARAIDYLLKPFDQERFDQAMEHAIEEIAHRRGAELAAAVTRLAEATSSSQGLHVETRPKYASRLAVRGRDKSILLRTDEIDWFEAAGDYVCAHLQFRSYLIDQSLACLQKKLDPDQFLRIHRGTIVNIDRLKELHPYANGEYFALLGDGTRLKVSRTYGPAVAARFELS